MSSKPMDASVGDLGIEAQILCGAFFARSETTMGMSLGSGIDDIVPAPCLFSISDTIRGYFNRSLYTCRSKGADAKKTTNDLPSSPAKKA